MAQEDSRECEAMRKIFVGGLNRSTTQDTFFDYFGQYGNMVDKVIMTDRETKESRGFGFITYDNSDVVESVFQSRPHNIDGKEVDVKRAIPKDHNNSSAHAKVTKLFIGGVGPDMTPECLQTYIDSRHSSDFGTIEKIDLLKDRDTNKNKGFGFLECSSTDFADRLVISEMEFFLNGKKMTLKKAEPKGEVGGGDRGGRGGRGGYASRGGGRGRGATGGRGGGRGGSYGGQDNGYNNGYNNYSTAYPGVGDNNGYNNYQQNQPAGGNYGGGYGGGYGANQGQAAGGGGWNSGGGNRYQPY